MYYKTTSSQSDSNQQNALSKSNSGETEDEVAYQNLLLAFEALAGIADPIRFPLLFEQEQRRSGLRLSTFRQAYQAWLTQREAGGIE